MSEEPDFAVISTEYVSAELGIVIRASRFDRESIFSSEKGLEKGFGFANLEKTFDDL